MLSFFVLFIFCELVLFRNQTSAQVISFHSWYVKFSVTGELLNCWHSQRHVKLGIRRCLEQNKNFNRVNFWSFTRIPKAKLQLLTLHKSVTLRKLNFFYHHLQNKSFSSSKNFGKREITLFFERTVIKTFINGGRLLQDVIAHKP